MLLPLFISALNTRQLERAEVRPYGGTESYADDGVSLTFRARSGAARGRTPRTAAAVVAAGADTTTAGPLAATQLGDQTSIVSYRISALDAFLLVVVLCRSLARSLAVQISVGDRVTYCCRPRLRRIGRQTSAAAFTLRYITLETIYSGLSKSDFKDHYGDAVI